MSIHEKLLEIQKELKVPKTLYNTFGNYSYRSCESILEAVKPLCFEQKCTLVIFDDIVITGAENYVKATAVLADTESNEKIEVTAFARESTTKKGMDSSQITGASSSYARKYALNGLFLIDDTKDADSENGVVEKPNDKSPINSMPRKTDPTPIDALKVAEIITLTEKKGVSISNVVKAYKKTALNELTVAEYEDCKRQLLRKADKVTTHD